MLNMMDFVFKTRNCVSKTRDFVLNMMNFVFITRNCVLKTRNFVLNMMDFAALNGTARVCQ